MTEPRLARFSFYTARELSDLLREGRVDRRALEADAREYAIMTKQIVSAVHANNQLRRLESAYNSKQVKEAEHSHRLAEFVSDCIADGMTYAEFEYGLHQWRRQDTSFMPTYGQFLALVRPDGERVVKSAFAYSRQVQDALSGPAEHMPALPEPKRDARGDLAREVEENRKLVDRMKTEKRNGTVLRLNRPARDWNKIDDDFLETAEKRLASSVKRLEAAQ